MTHENMFVVRCAIARRRLEQVRFTDGPALNFELVCGDATEIIRLDAPGADLSIVIAGNADHWAPILGGLPGGLHRAWRRDLLRLEGDVGSLVPVWDRLWQLSCALAGQEPGGDGPEPGGRFGPREAGTLDGRPVVLLHGAGQDGAVWNDLLTHPLEGHRLFAPDLPGHGADHSAPTGDYAALSDWLADFCSERNITAPVLVGHSFAGCLALHHVQAGRDCGGVVMVNSTASARGAWSAEKLALIERDPRAWFSVHFRAACSTQAPSGSIDRLTGDLRRTLAPDTMMRDMAMFGTADYSAALRTLAVPLQVLHGADDWSLPPALGRAMAEAADAGFEEIPDAGHFPHIEQPVAFRAALQRALSAQAPNG